MSRFLERDWFEKSLGVIRGALLKIDCVDVRLSIAML